MFRRARQIALATLLTLTPAIGSAQIIWQPTPVPLVTAENTTWFQSGQAIEYNGELYYPSGPVEFFNPFQMVRTLSFRGIPLYIDTTLEPNSIVFVPLSGGRMQSYERRRIGELAGTTGARPSLLPPEVGGGTVAREGLNEAPGGVSSAPAYDVGLPVAVSPRPLPEPRPVGTSGRVTMVPEAGPETTLKPPTGLNAIWINFDGRRWYATGKAIDYDASVLTEIGIYHDWSVYVRNGDRSTIYIPSTPGKLAPYKAR